MRVYPIPGLRFHYARGRLAIAKSIGNGVRFWTNQKAAINSLLPTIVSKKPDLIISDFEPLMPRVAERCGIPYVSIDHQHFLTHYDLSALPFRLKLWASLMKLAVALHYQRQRKTIITSFFHLPLLPGRENTVSVGPIVRHSIRVAKPTRGDYLISYLREHTSDAVLREMASTPFEIKVYGLGVRPRMKNIRFLPFDQHQFVQDLAGAMAVIGAAGNQTLGESLQLGKPVLALPEARHYEQRINAFYLRHRGYGESVLLPEFRGSHLREFVHSLGDYVSSLQDLPDCGNATTISLIEEFLGTDSCARLVA